MSILTFFGCDHKFMFSKTAFSFLHVSIYLYEYFIGTGMEMLLLESGERTSSGCFLCAFVYFMCFYLHLLQIQIKFGQFNRTGLSQESVFVVL